MLFREWLCLEENVQDIKRVVVEAVCLFLEQGGDEQKYIDAAHTMRWHAQLKEEASKQLSRQERAAVEEKMATLSQQRGKAVSILDAMSPEQLERGMPEEARQRYPNAVALANDIERARDVIGELFEVARTAAERKTGNPERALEIIGPMFEKLLTQITEKSKGQYKPISDIFQRGVAAYMPLLAKRGSDILRTQEKLRAKPFFQSVEMTPEEKAEKEAEKYRGMSPEQIAQIQAREKKRGHLMVPTEIGAGEEGEEWEPGLGIGGARRGRVGDPVMGRETAPTVVTGKGGQRPGGGAETFGRSPFKIPDRELMQSEREELLFRALEQLKQTGDEGYRQAMILLCYYGFNKNERGEYEPHISAGMRSVGLKEGGAQRHCAAEWNKLEHEARKERSEDFMRSAPNVIAKLPNDIQKTLNENVFKNKAEIDRLLDEQMAAVDTLLQQMKKDWNNATNQRYKHRPGSKEHKLWKGREDRLNQLMIRIPLWALPPVPQVRGQKIVPMQRPSAAGQEKHTTQMAQRSQEHLEKALAGVKKIAKLGRGEGSSLGRGHSRMFDAIVERRKELDKRTRQQTVAVHNVIHDIRDYLRQLQKAPWKSGNAIAIFELKDLIDSLTDTMLPFIPATTGMVNNWLDKGRNALKTIKIPVTHGYAKVSEMIPLKHLLYGLPEEEAKRRKAEREQMIRGLSPLTSPEQRERISKPFSPPKSPEQEQ